MRNQRRRSHYLLVVSATLACASAAFAAPRPSPVEMKEDASLSDVVFLDADSGWAVGDRGAIWRTRDGGRRWELQPSPVHCRLESICFVNNRHGWIVGGWTHPYTHKSSAVLLRTVNGGQTWSEVEQPTLPALKYVKFFDDRRGWAVGNASAMYATGIFQSADGGKTWTPLASGRGTQWLAADFRSPFVGAVAGHHGSLGLILDKSVKPTQTPDLGPRALHDIQLGKGTGWLVGEGGLIMRTTDGGLTWQHPPGTLPWGVSTQCDFFAVAAINDHVWVAGAPGSIVLHSPDQGTTWRTLRTGQSLPIRTLHFVDERVGFAAGALGMILATRDGGQTWQPQHSGGSRVALLGVFSEPRRIPHEAFAATSGNDGYLSAVETFVRRASDRSATAETSEAERAHDAVVSVGGSFAASTSQFPVMQQRLGLSRDAIVRGWDSLTDGRGLDALEERLVLKIRQWRPDVILGESTATEVDALAEITGQLVQSAVRKAGDPTSFPNQLAELGLTPWKTKKLFLTPVRHGAATVSMTTSQLATRLGCSYAEYAAIARGLTYAKHESPMPTIGFQLVASNSSTPRKNQLFSGILLQPGGEARRQLSQARGNLPQLTRAAQKRRNMQRLIDNREKVDALSAAWLGEVDDLTSGMSQQSAGDILHQLALRYHAGGRSEMAAEVLQRLIKRYPKHDLTEASMLWLVRYYSSGEVAYRRKKSERIMTQLLQPPPAGPVQQASASDAVLRPREERPRVAISSNYGLKRWRASEDAQIDELNSSNRSGLAMKIGAYVQGTQPGLYADPRLRFPLLAAARQGGAERAAESFLRRLASSDSDTPWSICAKGELWLGHATGLAPQTTIACRQVTAPHLDGKLDDACWQDAPPMELTSSLHEDVSWTARAYIVHDQQFVYLAATCRLAPEANYPETNLPRPRDPSLDKEDRVTFIIDIDRDYGTFYELTMDHRGWLSESCFGDRSWNPKWYAAASKDEQAWTCEAAIPFSELVPGGKPHDTAWAVGVQRTVPGVGFQSWTKPAEIDPVPEGLGLLIIK